ncbi:hypothetical protein PACTADRAFT_49927 [Pachysolen tannophilus NRRL Y-2460]|uniref:Endoplasmic reticulum-Golgi intermediate compartment protein n=1 Tax=Pachysolen tannophilus NRRL Y-2460 TaxID=669874 RepID=A0A1E4TTW3_PACTA|nr:hypothetical protein PACTADRAFT_49927 [Pachysolen tannophilus NRRL Y-2460]
MAKPRLLNLDAFAKTVEDAKVRTASGGLITVGCILVVLMLIMNEWIDYRTIAIRPELVVDRDRSKKLDINIDVSFPNMPCDLLTLDIMDVSGDLQADLLKSGFQKYRLNPDGEQLDGGEFIINQDIKDLITTNDPNYCGSCYGAISQEGNDQKKLEDKVCCNTCESVKAAYAQVAWAFYDGKDIEQCEKSGYVEQINQRLDEGCRIKGTVEINRLAGNLHFAPGSSLTIPGKHVHDMSLYYKHENRFNFDHEINHFSFGPDPHEGREIEMVKNTKNDVVTSTHPLDGHKVIKNEKNHLFSYYLKVVATRYEFLNGNTLETNQFSSTYHDRPLQGGKDEDHPHTLHARGGIPSLFFYFDISPLKVINREQYLKSLSSFLLGACSAVGGVLTMGYALDRTVWTANKMLKQKKDT